MAFYLLLGQRYGTRRRIFLASLAATRPALRSFRLRFLPFEESKWLLKALLLLTLPVPVTLNLFAAPRLVLIFGIFTPYSRIVPASETQSLIDGEGFGRSAVSTSEPA